MTELRSLIRYEKAFFPREYVDAITLYAKAYDNLFIDHGNTEKEFTVHTYHNIEANSPELLGQMQKGAREVYDYVTSQYSGKFEDFYEFKTHIARFEPGFGMHEHFDSSRPNDIATLVYLNNDYSGGEIYFPKYDISFKPEPGDLLCFPDNPDFVHGVKPIISGIRYTTPRWFTRIV